MGAPWGGGGSSQTNSCTPAPPAPWPRDKLTCCGLQDWDHVRVEVWATRPHAQHRPPWERSPTGPPSCCRAKRSPGLVLR